MRNVRTSKKIRERLIEDKQRFYACDNISKYVDEKDRESLIEEAEHGFDLVLDALLIDTKNDPNSQGTARRLAKMYINELLAGRFDKEPVITSFPNFTTTYDHSNPLAGPELVETKNYTGMLVVRAEIRSLCSHHFQPVVGTAYIGIIPDRNVLGLSKYIRIAQHLARRGTLQEELCQAIRLEVSKRTGTKNVAVYIEATHGCCENRGVGVSNSMTQTISLGGNFLTDVLNKNEFFENIKLQKL